MDSRLRGSDGPRLWSATPNPNRHPGLDPGSRFFLLAALGRRKSGTPDQGRGDEGCATLNSAGSTPAPAAGPPANNTARSPTRRPPPMPRTRYP
ncbi:hypothetical protein CA237_02260 [Sphingomonas sp. ABOLH]|nr:hypothetical protein CA237_02260 [Sphingomonas sp. ABOLH]